MSHTPAPAQTLDFHVPADLTISGVAVGLDGSALVTGSFKTLGGQDRRSLGRLNPDGSLDPTFHPQASNSVTAVQVQTDAKILIAGTFTNLAGQAASRLGRLNPDGSLDSSFKGVANSVNSRVDCLALQADSKILVGGSFSSLDGQSRVWLGRLNTDGSLDTNFNPVAFYSAIGGQEVVSIAIQPDSKILVGGFFTLFTGGRGITNLVRLNTNGAVDTSFHAFTQPGTVACLLVQPDSNILVSTSSYWPVTNSLFRLSPNGVLDTSFNPAINYTLQTVLLQADGKILAAGGFTSVGGQPWTNVARLQPDGTLDTTFNANISWRSAQTFPPSFALAAQPDGKIFLASTFPIINGMSSNYVRRISNTYDASQTLTSTASTISWMRADASPEVWRTTFDVSTNGLDWLPLGAGTRVAGGWQLTGLSLPDQVTVRARGFLTGGAANGSGSIIESSIGPAAISIQPANQTNILGAVARFNVVAAGDSPISYQWFKNDQLLNDADSLTGTATSTLLITNLSATDAASYSVVVTNLSGSVTSSPAILTLLDPRIIQIDDLTFASNQFAFTTHAVPGLSIVLEATTNFSDWVPLQTNLVPGSGQLFFEDPDSASLSNRFYRARSQ